MTNNTVFYIESNWNESTKDEGFSGDSMRQDWELSETDKLCFRCPLADCKENSKCCLINIAKAA